MESTPAEDYIKLSMEAQDLLQPASPGGFLKLLDSYRGVDGPRLLQLTRGIVDPAETVLLLSSKMRLSIYI